MIINRIDSKMIFLDTAESYTDKASAILKLYNPFPGISEVLTSLSAECPELYKSIIEGGEAALSQEYPYIRATDYMKFRREGNRALFEAVYFQKRHMLNSLVMAELAENKGRFTDHIIDGIFSICEESGWALPAHNTYIRNTEQFILPDSDRPVIDLFACETGALLSMILYLLSDKLDKVSDFICKRIRSELKKRIILPFINEHFWWMGDGNEPMCNWTPWCTQNVLLCAFLNNGIELSDSDRSDIFIKAAAAVDFFLKDYGVDGCCDEGAQYYKHAGLCLYGCMEILNAISEDAFNSLYEEDKIKNIAAYVALMHVSGPWYFNFSDCSPKAGRTGVREFLFGQKTQQNFLCSFAAKDYLKSVKEVSLLNDESLKLNLYYRTQGYYFYKDIVDYSLSDSFSETDASVPDVWYESVGLMTLRNDTLALAVKAGDNDDSHNHNDTGSITLYKNGNPILVDIGVETYSAKTFSNDRYSIWTMQSGYHNLPTLMGMDELPGANHCATNVELINNSDSGLKGISMNIENAYPSDISNNYYYKRTVTLDTANNKVILTDSTDIPDVIVNFITYEKPVVTEANEEATIITVGEAQLYINGASVKEIQTLPITDARLQTAWDHDLYRIRLTMSNQLAIKIS